MWAYDFVACRTHSGKPIRLLTVIDEWSRECLAIKVAPRLRSDDVLATLTELMVRRGVPEYIRSDNGPEFTAKRVRDWIERIGAKILYRAWEPMGERLQRELQREAKGRTAKRRDLLYVERGAGAYRRMEKYL